VISRRHRLFTLDRPVILHRHRLITLDRRRFRVATG